MLGGPGAFVTKFISGTSYFSVGAAYLAQAGGRPQFVGFVGFSGGF